MSLSPLDPSTVRAAAQAALDARLGLIDAIVAAQNERAAAAAKVAEVQAAERAAAATETAAIKAALDGGWSAPELRAAGLKVPQSVTKKATNTSAATKAGGPRTPRIRPTVTTTGDPGTSPTRDAEQSPATDHTESGHGVADENYANAS